MLIIASFMGGNIYSLLITSSPAPHQNINTTKMIEILYAIFAYWVFLIYSPSTHFLDNEYPAQLDLRFSKSGERRIPTTADQENCGCCWAVASATVFSTAVFDARIGKQSRLQRYSHQYLVDCIRPTTLNGCEGIPVTYAFNLIRTDGLPLDSFYEYNSGRTGRPQECGVESKVAIARTKKEGLFYKAEKFGTLQGTKAAMDYMTASRLPLVTRIFAPTSFGDYSGEFVYDPSVEECEEAERRQNETMHVITIVGYGSEAEKDFWLVQNSHGASWGIEGIGKFIRGQNKCGIEEFTYYIKSVVNIK